MEEEPLKLDGVQLRSAAAPQSTHAGLEEEAGARLVPARVFPYVPHSMCAQWLHVDLNPLSSFNLQVRATFSLFISPCKHNTANNGPNYLINK